MDSSRLRPYTDTNNAVKVTFQKGEKVEAIWSTDGQRYPGTIFHVYPNDNYEVLFNDGVKSRKKANQIFKLKKRPTRFLSKNLLSAQVPVTSKPLPGLIPVKTELGNEPSSAAPITTTPTTTVPPYLNSSNVKNESDSQSSSPSSKLPPPPPLVPTLPSSSSLEETGISSTTHNSTKNDRSRSNSINSKPISNSIPDDPGGTESPNPVVTSVPPTLSSEAVSSGLCTKKGFVYVQQPHYSVFDIPPTDLGKRRRRVHNYSRLAKGPPLKGAIIGDIDGLVDGESVSRPTSPASSVSGRSSPVEPIVGAPTSNRRKRSSTALTNNINRVKKLTPNRTSNSRTEAKVIDIDSDVVVNNSNSSPAAATISKSSNSSKRTSSVCDADKSVLLPQPKVNSTNNDSIIINSNNVEAPVSAKIEQPETNSGGVPSKRLRKPSSRFSAEEGYMDIFSSKRSKRMTQSPSSSPATATKSTPNDTTPKLQVQRPRSNSSKKTRELEPPVLFPEETQQVNVKVELPEKNSNEVDKVEENCDETRKINVQSESAALVVEKNDKKPIFINDIKASMDQVSSEEEELLDVGEYTVIEKLPKKKEHKHRNSLSDSKLTRLGLEPPPLVIKALSPHTSPKKSPVPACSNTINKVPAPKTSPTSAGPASLDKNRGLRRGGGRRWTMPSKSEKMHPSVVLNRLLQIPKAHVMVEKCDSLVSASSFPSSSFSDKAIPEVTTDATPSTSSDLPSSLSKSSSNRWRRKKRWGDGKHRWTKPRNKTGGLLPGIRPGIRLKDSITMQLIKRSRLQRRFEKRGRPKVALLTGITKKKLRKILESIKRRKLKRTSCSAETKFKDVRVDIINCVCGRTDEFGLMIQCEVCLCWQHGFCFNIHDSSRLPKFYVCQSCRCPKSVRPSKITESVRQETYKKGVLPYYSFAPKPSTRQQKIIKACDELSKVINSIDDSIRQNKIKEQIASAEPDNPKLYQWSTQRPAPKDQIQRWHFNKYFKSILRRLMSRHKKNPAYLEKLRNIINFRDKLKKYSQAFEEARLAIRRKIGPRGLILIEKLSEHQIKLDKIAKAKLQYAPIQVIRKQPVQIEKPSVSDSLQPPSFPPPSSGRENEEKVNEKKNNISNKSKPRGTFAEQLERLTERYEYLCDGTSSVDSDDSDFEEVLDTDERQQPGLTNTECSEVKITTESDASQTKDSSTTLHCSIKLEHCDLSKEHVSTDVGLVNGFFKGDESWDSSRDIESEGEPGPIDDIADGEEYWIQPQTDIYMKYKKYRSFILTGELEDDKDETDLTYTPSKTDVVRKDLLWDFDSELGLDEADVSEEDSESEFKTESSSEEFDSEDEEEQELSKTISDNIQSEQTSLKFWEKEITSLDDSKNFEDEDDDEDWEVEGTREEVSSTETDEDDDFAEDDPSISTKARRLVNTENSHLKNADGNAKPGVILVAASDSDAIVGEIVDVLIKVGPNDETIGTGEIVAGGKGQNFIRLINPKDSQVSKGSTHHSRTPLCKSCRESVGSKWTWDELNSAKGIEVVCADTILSYIQELKKYHTLGLWSAKSNVKVDLNKACGSLSNMESCENEPSNNNLLESTFQPRQLKDICREAVKPSKSQGTTGRNALVQDGVNVSSKSASSRVIPPTSAEEESILSLLSLSKTPVQFNGENVSELSIESLRRLTDQLQCSNGPLSEGLAKAVGQPLVNGKVNLQNCQGTVQNSKPVGTSSSSRGETVCVRCSLKGKHSKVLTVLSTFDPELANNISNDELLELHKELSEAVRKVRASAHVIKRAVFKRVAIMVDRMKAERIARAKGEKVIPISAQGNLALTKPEEYLHGLKSEYVDALLPYSTYFISRFTKRDELNKAKKSWVQDMIHKYIMVRKSLKDMYGTDNDEGRIGKEDKFYTALDNLRKSFDIVLTKKDIKMRRQNQNSENTNSNHLGPNGIKADVKRAAIETSKSASFVPPNLVNGDVSEEVDVPETNFILSTTNLTSNNGSGKLESNNSSHLSELELLARLATYPIQVEDVNALLGITSKEMETCDGGGSETIIDKNGTNISSGIECKLPNSDATLPTENTTTTTDVKSEQTPDLQLPNGQDDPMELDVTNDLQMLEENLALKTSDNLVIGGDMDLMNAIGTFGGTDDFKETEDSDLLLNVFDDPAFSEPQDEPKPCCSKSLTSSAPPPKQIAPMLQKLTPEICRGFLVEDIRAHQQIIDVQLDRVESEIMELERRRGKGLKEKEDDKLFSRLYSNMQMLIYNMDVLDRVMNQSVAEDDIDSESDEEEEEDDEAEDELDDDDDDEEEGEGVGGGTGSTTESSPSSDKEDEIDIDEVDVDMNTEDEDDSSDSEDNFEEVG